MPRHTPEKRRKNRQEKQTVKVKVKGKRLDGGKLSKAVKRILDTAFS